MGIEKDIKDQQNTYVELHTENQFPEDTVTEEDGFPITLDFTKEKIGLALGGGGLLGAYEIGVLEYLMTKGLTLDKFDAAIGTSVGSIVLAAVLSIGFEETKDLMLNITSDQIFEEDGILDTRYESINNYWNKVYIKKDNIGNIALMLRGLLGGSLTTTPLRNMIKQKVNEEAILNSGIDVGFCVTPSNAILKPQVKRGEDLIGFAADYVIASSSCWPVFKAYKVNGKSWIDGGYKSSHNANFLYEQSSCDKVIAVDLQSKERSTDVNMVHIISKTDLGSFLDFTPDQIQFNYQQGYKDAQDYFEKYVTIIK